MRPREILPGIHLDKQELESTGSVARHLEAEMKDMTVDC